MTPPIPHSLYTLAFLLLAACQLPDSSPASAADTLPAAVAIPSRGSDATLDIASWNVKWFGSQGNGPTDEELQLARVRDVIRGTDADIWGLVEVVDKKAWDRLVSLLPGYSAVLVSDRAVAGGARAYHVAEQKVGLLFKSSVARLVGARVILSEHDRAFAGRPPLEARLRVTMHGREHELVVVVLHMKAFADEESLRRRQAAGEALKRYLDATWPTQRVAVIGDWNDDVDTSIAPRRPSPYAGFVADPDYRFVTQPLSERRISSTTGYRELIDHHLVTNELAALLAPQGAEVYRVDRMIPRFDKTTSDHFPVISRYVLPRR